METCEYTEMTSLPTNSERSERDTLNAIRERLVDRVIFIGAIILIPSLAASLYRVVDTGWQLPLFFQIAAAVFTWLLYLLRRRIDWQVRAIFIIGLLFIIGVVGFLTYGLSSGDIIFIITAVVISYLIFDRNGGLTAFSIAMLMLIFLSMAVSRHWITFHVNFQIYNTSTSSWLDQTVSFGLIVGVLFVVVEGLYKALIDALVASERRTEELQLVTSDLEVEIDEHATADQALADSKALLSAVLESTQDWILSVDSQKFGLITYNSAYARFALEKRGVIVHPGMTLDELLPPDYVAIWYGFYRRALEEGPFQTEYLVAAKTHILNLSFNLLKRDGNIYGISVFAHNITERKNAEEALSQKAAFDSLMSWVSSRLAVSVGSEANEAVNDVLGRLAEFFSVDRVYAVITSPDLKFVQTVYEWRNQDVASIKQLLYDTAIKEFSWRVERFRSGQVVRINTLDDYPPDAAKDRMETIAMGAKSYLAVALKGLSGGVVGSIGFHTTFRERIWEDEDVRRLEIIADTLGISLERIRAEKALRESEEKYRTIIETSQEGIAIVDPLYNITYANKHLANMLDYTVDQMIGKPVSHFISANMRANVEERISKRKDGIAAMYDLSFVSQTGREVWMIVSAAPIFDAAGRFVGAFAMMTDITERKEAEQREKEREASKRDFYRRTILAATESKLVITDRGEIERIVGPSMVTWNIKHGEDLSNSRQALKAIAESLGMDEFRISDFVLIFGEATTNAYKHANGGIASVHRTVDGLMFVITDHGPGIQALLLPEVALRKGYTTAASLGMGYKAMISIADKVYLATDPEGTTVAAEMKLRPVALPLSLANLPDTW